MNSYKDRLAGDSNNSPQDSNFDGPSRRQRRMHATNGAGTTGYNPNSGPRFTGANQEEMKGTVISINSKQDISQQYENFVKKLYVLAGKTNPDVRAALQYGKPLKRTSLLTAKPDEDEYTTTVENRKIVDEDLKEMVMNLWVDENRRVAKRYEAYTEDLKKIYSIITGQLCEGTMSELEATDDWKTINQANDAIALMKHLKEICYTDSVSKTNPHVDFCRKMRKFLCNRQDNKDAGQFLEELQVNFDVLKAAGGFPVTDKMIKYTLKKKSELNGMTFEEYRDLADDDETRLAVIEATEQMCLANLMIVNSNARTHRGVAGLLQDEYILGGDKYPTTPARALAILNQYAVKKNSSPKPGTSNPNARGKPVGGNSGGNGRNGDSKDSKTEKATAFVTNKQKSSNQAPTEKEAHQFLMKSIEEEDTKDDDKDGVCFAHFAEVVPDKTKLNNGVNNYPESTYSSPSSPSLEHAFNYSADVHYVFTQTDNNIDPYWILLDSQANINMISNGKLLSNIRKHPNGDTVNVQCNAGRIKVDMIGDLRGFGWVWYYPQGIANILSMSLVSNDYRITMDTSICNSLFVHKPDGTTREFHRSASNLYICNLGPPKTAMPTITTVNQQKQYYSNLDIRRADKARKLQETLGFPSTKSFLHMIDNNLIMNCPVTRRDVLVAEDIYGINPNLVKGKSVRKQPKHAREDTLSSLSPKILKNYGDVTLSIDVTSVNGVRFFRSISRHLNFRTIKFIPDSKKKTLLNCIKTIAAVYAKRGFCVTQIHGDNEFECLREDLAGLTQPIDFFPVGAGDHEPYVERDNRTFKERFRCIFAGLPFKRITVRMIIELGYAITFWLNCWCNSSGISKTISPRELITGIRLDANKHLQFQFGEYVLGLHNETDNTMEPRAIDAIYLRPTGNPNGGVYVLDLQSGRRVHRTRARGAHMTDVIIQRVETMAIAQGCPAGLLFGNAKGNTTILDVDYDDEDSAGDESDDDYDDDEEYGDVPLDSDDLSEGDAEVIAGEDRNMSNPGVMEPQPEEPEPEVREPEMAKDDEPTPVEPAEVEMAEETPAPDEAEEEQDVEMREEVDASEEELHVDTDEDADDMTPDEHSADAPQEEPPQRLLNELRKLADHNAVGNVEPGVEATEGRSLRPRIRRTHNKYGNGEGYESSTRDRRVLFSDGYGPTIRHIERKHQKTVLVSRAIEEYNKLEASLATPQYTLNKGLKIFGEAGSAAVYKELLQLHERKVISPMMITELTKQQIKRSLPYLMFLRRKKCSKIKARGCADGRSQRDYISREEASSPTVSLHALMLSCVIDAIEGRYVATADVPGAFLQTEMPEDEEDVHIRLEGAMAELLAKIDPELYNSCMVTTKRGRKIIYAKAEKAIYGTLKAALLFWVKISGKLEEWGFDRNPYDMCTMNKIINGKQCTIMWHVDDLKISHVEKQVMENVLKDLNEEFGKESPLTMNLDPVHEYVGMTIDYSEKGKVKFSMFEYVEDILHGLPDDLKSNRTFTTPAADHLFTIDESKPPLPEDRADRFHRIVAKLLFIAKRARPDIQTAVAFLCTRVKSPDEDDERKLIRVLGYLKETLHIPLVLGTDGSNNVYWYVDASFAVHKDMKSHTGGVMTLGQGAVISMSTKQKLNTKSSTEAELVGVDDALPFNIWSHYFLKWQGCHAMGVNPQNSAKQGVLGERNILYQDNTSSIKLENNGKASSTKRTRHINIRYFTITDRVKNGEVTIEYCPTGDMIADFFTKPLQGSLFRKFRNLIMGVSEADTSEYKQAYYEAKAKRATSDVSGHSNG